MMSNSTFYVIIFYLDSIASDMTACSYWQRQEIELVGLICTYNEHDMSFWHIFAVDWYVMLPVIASALAGSEPHWQQTRELGSCGKCGSSI